jgi:hypothetical protein
MAQNMQHLAVSSHWQFQFGGQLKFEILVVQICPFWKFSLKCTELYPWHSDDQQSCHVGGIWKFRKPVFLSLWSLYIC